MDRQGEEENVLNGENYMHKGLKLRLGLDVGEMWECRMAKNWGREWNWGKHQG